MSEQKKVALEKTDYSSLEQGLSVALTQEHATLVHQNRQHTINKAKQLLESFEQQSQQQSVALEQVQLDDPVQRDVEFTPALWEIV